MVGAVGAGRGGSALPGRAVEPEPVSVRGRCGAGRAGPGRAMALLLEHEFKPLPADKQVETLPFLEAVAHLPPFFGEPGDDRLRGRELRQGPARYRPRHCA